MKSNTLVLLGLICVIFLVLSWTGAAGRAQLPQSKVEETKATKVKKDDHQINPGGGGYFSGGGGYYQGGGGYYGGGYYGGGGGYYRPCCVHFTNAAGKAQPQSKVEATKATKVGKDSHNDGDGGINKRHG